MNYKIDKIKTKVGVNNLYKCSAFTFEGFSLDKENIQGFLEYLKEEDVLKPSPTLSVIKGEVMNELYELTETNSYPKNLNIVAIHAKYLKNIQRLEIIRLEIGARWFDDIVDNNGIF